MAVSLAPVGDNDTSLLKFVKPVIAYSTGEPATVDWVDRISGSVADWLQTGERNTEIFNTVPVSGSVWDSFLEKSCA